MLEYVELADHIQYLAERFHRWGYRSVVTLILIELHIPTKHGGFDYLRCAISLYYADPAQIDAYGLYTAVARQFGGVSEYQVEKQIRRVIRIAWNKRCGSVWREFFPQDACPSNTEFISMLGRVMEMWRDCREKYEQTEDREGQLV